MGFLDWLWGKSKGTEPALRGPSVRPASTAPVQQTPAPAPPAFGIESAIALMRALPMEEDADLVLRVVRKTLRSTGVSVEEIVGSAKTREGSLEANVEKDRASIERLEREIVALKTNIDDLVTQLHETRSVRERLQDAIASESKVGFIVPPAEMARMQAEAAAAAIRPSAPKTPPQPIPKSSPPPVPKTGAPPPLKKSLAPKLPGSTSVNPTKPDVVPVASPKSSGALPDSEEEAGPPSEPTVRRPAGSPEDVSGMKDD